MVLGGHGLFTWGSNRKDCYQTTPGDDQPSRPMAQREHAKAFGGQRVDALPRAERRDVAAKLLPAIRKRISNRRAQRSATSRPRRRCWNSSLLRAQRLWRRSGRLAPIISCAPRSARWLLPFDRAARNLDFVLASLDQNIADYRADYQAYYRRCKRADSPPMRDPNAVIYLVPGVGMLSFAKDNIDCAHRKRVLRQCDQRDRGASGVWSLCRAEGAGGVRHRILAARGSQAARAGCPSGKSLS